MENVNFRKSILVIGSFLLSVYFVVFVWNFWENLIDALGLNLTIFILGFLALFFLSTGVNALKKNYFWVMPLILIALSFSLWENPFLKVINLLILPFLLSIFFAYALTTRRELSFRFVMFSILERILTIVKIKEASTLLFKQIDVVKGDKSKIFFRIALGLFLFSALALTIFIPLLSSADPAFAKMAKGLMDWFYSIISFKYINRVIFASLATFITISYFLSFQKKLEDISQAPASEKKLIDPIVSGIVLGGVLVLYLLFLFTQISHLWVNQLPINFSETERLVKSGFWQLFLLSVINILFFFAYFRKTNNIVQNVLKIFTLASFLLLFSAGYRMFLYVFYYGLSYEKFFASYAVIYFALIFIWLFYQLFNNREGHIFKFLAFSLLWMYAVLTVMPVERIIFSTNAKLSLRADSRIKLMELQMLSYDALPMVVAHSKDEKWQKDWCYWGYYKVKMVDKKKWYEKNFSNLAPANIPEFWKTSCAFEEEFIKSEVTEESHSSVQEPPKDTRRIYKNEKFSFEVKYPQEGWRVINWFSADKNRDEGGAVYKDALTSVSMMPLEDKNRVYPDAGATITEVKIDKYTGKKRVWKQKDGNYFMTIRLTSYPATWEKNHYIEAKYTKETEKEVGEIINSIVFF